MDEAAREALREKYTTHTPSVTSRNSGTTRMELSNEQIEASKRLDMTTICSYCQGIGEITEEYNFQRRTKTCPKCDGEGICRVTSSKLKSDTDQT